MKKILGVLLLIMLSWSSICCADFEEGMPIEVETAFGDSEEARADAEELKRMAREESRRRDQMKIKAQQSLAEAKRLEAEAVFQAGVARKEKKSSENKVHEYTKQIKATEKRKTAAQSRIQTAKNKVAAANKVRNDFKEKKEQTDKELKFLNDESANFERYVSEAHADAAKAQSEYQNAEKNLREVKIKTNNARANAKKRAAIARARENHYKNMTEKSNSARRSISSEH